MTIERPELNSIVTIQTTPYISLRGRYIGPDNNNPDNILVYHMTEVHSGEWIKLETKEND